MALNRVSSEEFSFPAIASKDSSSHHSGLDSPPLWKPSPESFRQEDYNRGFSRLVIGKDVDDDQTKSFSYVETRSLWRDRAEEKMDMLWEDLNEELPPRSQSLRFESGGDGGEDISSVLSGESTAVVGGCGMKLSKKAPPKKKKKSTNVLILMRVLKKLLVLRSLSQRSPAKTHPR